MPDDAQAQIDALRRAVLLLAEVTRGALVTLQQNNIESNFVSVDLRWVDRVDHALGQLDAIEPMLEAMLGPAPSPGGGDGEGEGAHGD